MSDSGPAVLSRQLIWEELEYETLSEIMLIIGVTSSLFFQVILKLLSFYISLLLFYCYVCVFIFAIVINLFVGCKTIIF